MKLAKRGQTWSLDALIGVGLFVIAAILLFYYLGNLETGKKPLEVVEKDATKLADLLSSSKYNTTIAFLIGTTVDSSKLFNISAFSDVSYDALKNQFGLQSDFCVYFEDKDGNVIPIQGNPPKYGFGSPKANISGKACNDTVTTT